MLIFSNLLFQFDPVVAVNESVPFLPKILPLGFQMLNPFILRDNKQVFENAFTWNFLIDFTFWISVSKKCFGLSVM